VAGTLLLVAALMGPAIAVRADDEKVRQLTHPESHASSDSFAFGDYTGLEEEGWYLLSNLDLRRRGLLGSSDDRYVRLRGLNLGLESRRIDAEYGRQGRYGVYFLYDEIPVFDTSSAQTFYLKTGDSDLVMPPGWVPGADPSEMTEFDANLRMIDVDWRRKRYGGGFSVALPANLEFESSYLWESKKGSKLMAAVMGLSGGSPRSVIAPERLDYVTQQIEAALRYGGENLQLSLGYYGSGFDSKNDDFTFEDAYTAAVGRSWSPLAGYQGTPDGGVADPACIAAPGCGFGRKAQMPDSWFHQIIASGGYSLPYQTRVTLDAAFGWMLQDDDFQPFSVNPLLTAVTQGGAPTNGTDLAALPRSSLDGEIFTTVIDLRVASRPVSKVRLGGGYRFENRDNDTPRDLYVYIRGDAEDQGDIDGGTARINKPYSLERHEVELNAGYQLPLRSELTLGYGWELEKRDLQEVSKLHEHTVGATLTSRPASWANARVIYEHSWRNGSTYKPAEPFLEGFSAEHLEEERLDLNCAGLGLSDQECLWENHPLLRRYYLADRRRDDLRVLMTFMPVEMLSIGLNVHWTDDDYNDTDVGLTRVRQLVPGVDVSLHPFDCVSLYAYYTWQRTRMEQRGWSLGGDKLGDATDPTLRWSIKDTDRTHTVGVGASFDVLPDRLTLGADFVYSQTHGVYNLSRAGVAGEGNPFPDNIERLYDVSVSAEYRFTQNLSVRAGYLFETLKTRDWALDGLEPDSFQCSTNACVIGSGRNSPGYHSHLVSWSLVYRFW
jgi:MtrB/PioB family decaheme-associated outer membrane protein